MRINGKINVGLSTALMLKMFSISSFYPPLHTHITWRSLHLSSSTTTSSGASHPKLCQQQQRRKKSKRWDTFHSLIQFPFYIVRSICHDAQRYRKKKNALYGTHIWRDGYGILPALCGIVHLWALMSFSKLLASLTHTLHTCGQNQKKKLNQPNKNSCLSAQIRMMFPKKKHPKKRRKKIGKTFHSDRALQITFHFLIVFLLLFSCTLFSLRLIRSIHFIVCDDGLLH